MKSYLDLLRVHHYIKNMLIFVPLACSGQLLNSEKLNAGIWGFLSFCMLSSVVYIINDIRDKEKDSKHPSKCKRPIASGLISVRNAKWLSLFVLTISIACNYFVFNFLSTFLLWIYLFLNLAYSYKFKNFPILDVTILVAGFIIRILYGSLITEIFISNWLYLTVITVSFFFALGKRRNELKQIGSNKTRQVLSFYTINFLDKNMYMCLTLANTFYALWSMDKNTISHYDNQYLVLTVPIVLLITMKYSLTIEREIDGDPVEVLIHDKVLLILCMLYLLTMLVILYF